MLQNLNELKKSLSDTIPDNFKKDDLLEVLKETVKSIAVTLDTLEDSLPIFKDKNINDIDGYILLEQIASQIGLKTSKVDDVLLYLISVLENFKKDSNVVQNHIVDMEDIIIRDNIKLRDAAMYRLVNDISFINRFSLDILNYVLTLAKAKKSALIRNEDVKLVSDAMISEEFWYKMMSENSLNFTDLLADKYKEFDIDDLKDSAFDTLIPLGSAEADGFLKTILDKIFNRNKSVQIVGAYNFRYSPIFWIGKMIIKSRIAKAKSMREKQEMLKYKILDIKAMADDGKISNEKMQKAIDHYQREIDNMEYKIDKILDN